MNFIKRILSILLVTSAASSCSELTNDGTSGAIPFDPTKMNNEQFIRVFELYQPLENNSPINVGSFAEEFENNSIVAEEKYSQEAIKVRGKVHSIDKDFTGEINVILMDPNEIFSIDSVSCNNVTLGTAKTLKKGQIITVYGYVKKNTDFGVNLAWCYFGEQTPTQQIERLKNT